jgi:hypothetical protein
LGHAVIFDSAGVHDLNSLLDPVTGAGWMLAEATGINNRGQIIGFGIHNDQALGFLLTPIVSGPDRFDQGCADPRAPYGARPVVARQGQAIPSHLTGLTRGRILAHRVGLVSSIDDRPTSETDHAIQTDRSQHDAKRRSPLGG